MKKILQRLPEILSSKISIFIYLFLFFYLVVYALLCAAVVPLRQHAPSNDAQLIMGNYTNVLSALGASIAAGTGAITHANVKKLHEKHDKLQKSIDALHEKIDQIDTDGK